MSILLYRHNLQIKDTFKTVQWLANALVNLRTAVWAQAPKNSFLLAWFWDEFICFRLGLVLPVLDHLLGQEGDADQAEEDAHAHQRVDEEHRHAFNEFFWLESNYVRLGPLVNSS